MSTFTIALYCSPLPSSRASTSNETFNNLQFQLPPSLRSVAVARSRAFHSNPPGLFVFQVQQAFLFNQHLCRKQPILPTLIGPFFHESQSHFLRDALSDCPHHTGCFLYGLKERYAFISRVHHNANHMHSPWYAMWQSRQEPGYFAVPSVVSLALSFVVSCLQRDVGPLTKDSSGILDWM